MLTAIKCRGSGCGNILGQLVAGRVLIRHHGREIAIGRADVTIQCEDCGRVWDSAVELPPPSPSPDTLALPGVVDAEQRKARRQLGRPA